MLNINDHSPAPNSSIYYHASYFTKDYLYATDGEVEPGMLDGYVGECTGLNNQHFVMVSKNLLVGIKIVIPV
jgi:hypothetical protein